MEYCIGSYFLRKEWEVHGKKNSDRRSGADESPIENS
jgi:hypothetical protein